MHVKKYLGLCAAVVASVAFALPVTTWAATHEVVLHNFNPAGSGGSFPWSTLVSDAAGNRYGTTYQGGSDNVGTVFELSPDGNGGWTQRVIHNFRNDGIDGINPEAGVILDATGNLYGTTNQGGDFGGGTVFELAPNGSGGWTETKLHNFSYPGGSLPDAGLIFDGSGNLYGTASQGGDFGGGTVFELSPNGSGGWTETKLHNFGISQTDGVSPYATLVRDSVGNLYGTTNQGGDYFRGTVFEVSPNGSGGWTETKLHNFGINQTDGAQPYAGLVLDTAGNLYGTTSLGGDYNAGAAFEVSPNGNGGWTEKKLHSFGINSTDGAVPYAGLILDSTGNLYGTTSQGGTHYGGTVYELLPNGSGGWTETKLHNFNNDGVDGAYPQASLSMDSSGNLYGTTYNGGSYSVGTTFELSPKQGGGWNESVLYSFNYNGRDGANPIYANLISDAAGNLYGVTGLGGAYNAGIVFELSPDGNGGWRETVLHNFKNQNSDGGTPYGTLMFDGAGNLYGTTLQGGYPGNGTVYELSPNGGGGWVEKILHNFGNGTDGGFPFAGVIFDRAGNMYGTTYQGGDHNNGTVYEMSPNGSGGWTEKKLHNFDLGTLDGGLPYAGVVMDAAGNLYGTTYLGGNYGLGTAYEMTTNGSGGWNEKKLHNFDPNGVDGFLPYAGLIMDSGGNLYGTTGQGGSYQGGTMFALAPNGNGGWTENILHNFGNPPDGAIPFAGLTFDPHGNLYGTTYSGGDYGVGTSFEMSPNGTGGWNETKLHNFFNNNSDGTFPQSGVVFDAAGNLYGTTTTGGIYKSGTVYSITAQ